MPSNSSCSKRREPVDRAFARRRDQLRRRELVHRQPDRQRLLDRRRRDPFAGAARRGEAHERMQPGAGHGHRIHDAAAHPVVLHRLQETVERGRRHARAAVALAMLAAQLLQIPHDRHVAHTRAKRARIDVVMAVAHVVAAVGGRRERLVQIETLDALARELEREIREGREAGQVQQARDDPVALGRALRLRERIGDAELRRVRLRDLAELDVVAPDDLHRPLPQRIRVRDRTLRQTGHAAWGDRFFMQCNIGHEPSLGIDAHRRAVAVSYTV